ncbi:hypothetical protein EDEG_00405 [Edhazardia aedis USNM 41457]|uniref:Uncharacterized protein n=1 Tax=Edhazardia aedis (strain USNM 41457) TaxID=1003232 RepID=J9DG78_EDHAE|nr:hypothetical protein EDEG_00405 [Edhazardia aedis USNM 41457]|eukprot:EJW01590.1 hypothetical protein EDEG_00405 [Edhazardia aedis USNM 41457]
MINLCKKFYIFFLKKSLYTRIFIYTYVFIFYFHILNKKIILEKHLKNVIYIFISQNNKSNLIKIFWLIICQFSVNKKNSWRTINYSHINVTITFLFYHKMLLS